MFRPSLALLFLLVPLSLPASAVAQTEPPPAAQGSIAEDPRFWLWPENAQQLTAEAALTGDYKTALQAFIQDPQTQARLAMEDIEKLMRELFEAHREHLPQVA